jgi:hypothetical protein
LLDIEAFPLPIEQQIWKQNADTIIQLLSRKEIRAELSEYKDSIHTATGSDDAEKSSNIVTTSRERTTRSDCKPAVSLEI